MSVAASLLPHEALGALPDFRCVRHNEPDDAEVSVLAMAQDEGWALDAETVDGRPFEVLEVAGGERSGFTHFLDGGQRSRLLGYERFSPVYIAHTSAAILERVDGLIAPPGEGWWDGGLELYAPSNTAYRETFARILPVQTYQAEEQKGTVNMKIRAAKRISARRDERERGLAAAFTDGRLLIDGSIPAAGKADGRFMIGVVKSHTRQYFASEERVRLLFEMRAGQRSSVFHTSSPDGSAPSVYSFYLRLLEHPVGGPMFGLVRVELPPTETMLAQVDRIAAWLMDETAPLSLPDSRYDRLLYPIHVVEEHLAARRPSEAYISANF